MSDEIEQNDVEANIAGPSDRDRYKNTIDVSRYDKQNLRILNKLITSAKDNSAKISSVLKKYECKEFWTKNLILEDVLKYFVENNNGNLLNLFSLLMHDWHDKTDNLSNYFLIKKFKVFETISSGEKTLFDLLFSVIDDENQIIYHRICLMIIHYYFDELESNLPDNNIPDLDLYKLIKNAMSIRNSEYRIDILRISVIFLPIIDHNNYKDLKYEILHNVKNELQYISVCNISHHSIKKFCDSNFFNLVFLLKENQVSRFKVEYIKFIESHKTLYGEYWAHAIKLSAQLLYHMAEIQSLRDSSEFILISTGEFELKHSFIFHYEKLKDFFVVLNGTLDKKSAKELIMLENFIEHDFLWNYDDYEIYFNIHGFMDKFKNTPTIRKLLFGRRDLSSMSLFEKILSRNNSNQYEKPDKEYVFNYIWSEFRLWDIPEILTMKNPSGKTLIQYALETKNNHHLIRFLMVEPTEYIKTIHKAKQNMMLKNALFNDHNDGKSLIDFHLNLIDENKKNDPEDLKIIFYLFEEIGIYTKEQNEENEFIENLIDKVMKEKAEIFNGKDELKLPRKHFLVGVLLIYWKRGINKRTSKTFSPYFKLLFLILTGNKDDFHKEFPGEMQNIEESFKYIYNLDNMYDNKHIHTDDENIFHFYEKYSTNLSFIFLYAAIKTKQECIIDHIFKYNNYLITEPTFPTNMEASEIHYHTALKFLENKYEIGRNTLPREWITHDVLEKFLDSRISSYGGFYKVDCRFLLPYYNYDVNIKSANQVNDDLIFNEDYDTMEYIISEHELKSLITHPVLEMITTVKIQKYRRIMIWNLIAFITSYIAPTLGLVYLFHLSGIIPIGISSVIPKDNKIVDALDMTTTNWILNMILLLAIIRLPYIGLREYFQYRFIYTNNYLSLKSNKVELTLIISSILHLMAIICYCFSPNYILIQIVNILGILNMIAMICATVFMLPTLKFSIYMKCFRKILSTYIKIFVNFFPIFIGIAALALIIFDGNDLGSVWKDFLSDVIMYSGIQSVEVERISGFLQGVFLTILIILVINKANLVISIAVSDIRLLMDQSKELSLIYNARKYVEFAKKIRIFHAITEYKDKLSWREKIMKEILRKCLNKYPYTHRIQALYIDKKSNNLFTDAEKSIFELNGSKIFTKNFVSQFINYLLYGKFEIEMETMLKIQKIVEHLKSCLFGRRE